jgi:tetratricopeptide (TPR) repeat protein
MRRSLIGVALSLWVTAGCATPPAAESPGIAGRHDDDPVAVRREAEGSMSRGEHLLSRARRGGRVDAALVTRAVATFHEALARDPLLFQAHLRLASCYYLLQQHELEETEYLKCLAVNPRCLEALENLGHCRLAVDDLLGAREAYERALALQPAAEQDVILFNLYLVERDLGDRPARVSELYERFQLGKLRAPRTDDVSSD